MKLSELYFNDEKLGKLCTETIVWYPQELQYYDIKNNPRKKKIYNNKELRPGFVISSNANTITVLACGHSKPKNEYGVAINTEGVGTTYVYCDRVKSNIPISFEWGVFDENSNLVLDDKGKPITVQRRIDIISTSQINLSNEKKAEILQKYLDFIKSKQQPASNIKEDINSSSLNDFINQLYELRQKGISENGEFSLENLVFKEFRNLGYLDNLKELAKEERSKELSLEQLNESKQDINNFINKFGQANYDNFIKAKDRLKNKGYSTDITYYVKNVEKEDLEKLILSLYDKEKDVQKKRILQGTDKEIRGKYNYLGTQNGFAVYEPLDYLSSMDLGVNTGWCTTGRYGHYGHPDFTPSEKEAKRHWDDYTSKGIRFFYFLNPDTMYGEYALALYPKVLKPEQFINEDIYLEKTNFEIYNAKDNLDYSVTNKLPVNLIPTKVVLDYTKTESGLLLSKDRKYILKIYKNIKECAIPDSVKEIGYDAFYNCKSLTSIIIPNSVKEIGTNAFAYCTSLTSITIPDSVTKIGGGVFSECKSLESITISNSVTYIGDFTFAYCTSLKSMNIPNSVIHIGTGAFYMCTSLTSITIPNSVTHIGNDAFEDCNLLTVYTDNEYVKNYCRYYNIPCNGLKEEVIKEQLNESKQDELNFKNWLNDEELANKFFKYRQSFKSPENDYYYWIKNKDPKELLAFIQNYETSKQSKEQKHQEDMQGAKFLGEENGFKCYHITTWKASKKLGQGAKWCISMRDDNQYWKDYTSKGIKFYFFISPSTKYALALYPEALKPKQFINEDTYVEKANFEIYNATDNLDYSAVDKLPLNIIPEELVLDYNKLENGLVLSKDKKTLIRAAENIKECVIPNSVAYIDNSAFSECDSLTSVTIPNSVIEIGDGAFHNCKSLQSINIPNSVIYISYRAFANCTSLTIYTDNDYVKAYCKVWDIPCKRLK